MSPHPICYRALALVIIFLHGVVAASKIGTERTGVYDWSDVAWRVFVIAWAMLLGGLATVEWLAEKSKSDESKPDRQ